VSRSKETAAALASVLAVVALAASPARAQTPEPPATPAKQVAEPVQDDVDEDRVMNPAQPEYTIVNLPTTLRLPRNGFAFRVTHRFARDLGSGDFGDLVEDFFGFDSGALIGLELRYGLMRGWQAGIYRTSDRTIQLFTQYNVLRQAGRSPVNVDALATLEGTNNLKADDPAQPTGEAVKSPALGAVVSRLFGRTASIALTAAWVDNTNPFPSEVVDANDTVILGIGGRLRIRPTVYLVGEVVPRVAGNDPGVTLASFGIEKRVGGHAFQVNFSNGTGSTLAQIARGGIASDRWHIGFNINRKFY
jgi:hypothetical protein